MPAKKDADTSPGAKLLRFVSRLSDGKKHYQVDLVKELNCSPQTVMRLVTEVESVMGGALTTEIDKGRRWYQLGKETDSLNAALNGFVDGKPEGSLRKQLYRVADDISKMQIKAQDQEVLDELVGAFQHENLGNDIRAREKYRIRGPRRHLTLDDVNVRLYISTPRLLSAIKNGHSFRLKNYRFNQVERTVVEYYEQNSPYGVFIDRSSPITIISTHSGDQTFMGHYTARLAEAANANYLSVELYSAGALQVDRRLNFCQNPAWCFEGACEDAPVEIFRRHLNSVVKPGGLAVYFRAAASSVEGDFHVLYGGMPACEDVRPGQATCARQRVDAFKLGLGERVEPFNLQVSGHESFGNHFANDIGRYLHDKLRADAIAVYVSVRVLNAEAHQYYGSIRALADSLGEIAVRRDLEE